MKIAVLSDTRVPTRHSGSHGLGRAAMELATALIEAGHTVTLYAGAGSEAPDGGDLTIHADETERVKTLTKPAHDVWLDVSHKHDVSAVYPDWPVVNYILDNECRYPPPQCVVGNEWQQRAFREARMVRYGVPVHDQFYDTPKLYLAYAAKIHPAKGYDIARDVMLNTGRPVHFAGEKLVNDFIPNYMGHFDDNAQLWRFIGEASALLAPSRNDAGGRIVIEAAFAGTPTLTLDVTGTRYMVEHGVSGFVCRDLGELIDALQDIPLLDRKTVREWAIEYHSMDSMMAQLTPLLTAVADGERW